MRGWVLLMLASACAVPLRSAVAEQAVEAKIGWARLSVEHQLIFCGAEDGDPPSDYLAAVSRELRLVMVARHVSATAALKDMVRRYCTHPAVEKEKR